MAIYVTSDTHFGHDREFIWKPRGCSSIREHDDWLNEQFASVLTEFDDLYILGAQENIVEVLNTKEDIITDKLFLNTNAFATNITPIENSNLIMVTNAMSGLYSVIDTELKEVIKTSPIDVPVRTIVITNKVRTIK